MQLAKLCDRLRPTINVVKEVAASPSPQGGSQPAPLRLSGGAAAEIAGAVQDGEAEGICAGTEEAPDGHKVCGGYCGGAGFLGDGGGVDAAEIYRGQSMRGRDDMGDKGNQVRFQRQYSMVKPVEHAELERDAQKNEEIRKIEVLPTSAPVQTGNAARMVIVLPKAEETEVASGITRTNGSSGKLFLGEWKFRG